jgi:hypothetical protein
MPIKFEWQFKYRDERFLNGGAPSRHAICETPAIMRVFCISQISVYLAGWGSRNHRANADVTSMSDRYLRPTFYAARSAYGGLTETPDGTASS